MDNDVNLFVFYHYDFYYLVQQLYYQHNFKKLQVWAFEILKGDDSITNDINDKNSRQEFSPFQIKRLSDYFSAKQIREAARAVDQ